MVDDGLKDEIEAKKEDDNHKASDVIDKGHNMKEPAPKNDKEKYGEIFNFNMCSLNNLLSTIFNSVAMKLHRRAVSEDRSISRDATNI